MQALATVALMASLLGAGPSADPTLAEARAHVEAAKKAFLGRKFGVALQEFQAAQKLKPAPVLWFNIGKCYEKLNEIPSALRAFRTYLNEAPATPDRKQVETAIKRMETKLRARGVQQLMVLAQPPGATVTVAGKGTLPVPATFELRPGSYTVSVSLAGYQAQQKQVTVTARGSVQVEMVLQPAGGPVASAEEPPAPLVEPPVKMPPPPPDSSQGSVIVAVRPKEPPPPRGSDRPLQPRPPLDRSPLIAEPRSPSALGEAPPPRGRTWTWVAGGASLVGVGVGVGFGLQVRSAQAELLGSVHTETEANDIYTRARSSALYANVGYGAAAAAGLAAIVLFLVESPPSSTAQATSPPVAGGAPMVLSF
ncbi:MAG TPA: PEGA domain-containing protein [Myxococcales bacterium]|nr:PEGA domain-containing protein [Myxococcales bacterium]